MLAVLWKIEILSATAVFGMKTGLALGFSGLSRKVICLIVLVYVVGLYGLVLVASRFLPLLHDLAAKYNYVVFLAMSLVIVLTGLHTLREWQVHKKDCTRISWLALAAPCPCCYGAVILTIALAAPFLGVSVVLLGKYAALILGTAILASCFLAGQIVRLTKKPHPVLLGQLMLLVGFYFLACAVIMPNTGCLEAVKMSPLVIPSFKATAALLGVVLILCLIGVFKQTKKGMLR